MSKGAKSLFFFGIYLVALGIVLLVAPNLLLDLFGLPITSEVWIRIVGVLVCILAFYYTQAARNELEVFFKLTVVARSSLTVFFVVFVLLDLVGWQLILFGLIDLAGAIWTALAMRT